MNDEKYIASDLASTKNFRTYLLLIGRGFILFRQNRELFGKLHECNKLKA
jgi:hypothetical protein